MSEKIKKNQAKRIGIFVYRILTRVLFGTMILIALFLIIRIWQLEKGPDLHRWHTWVPDEMSAEQIDKTSFKEYLAAEDVLFQEVKKNVTDKLTPEEAEPLNRYYAGSDVYPDKLAQNWNRSYILIPPGTIRGAVVLLHGLTDTPYSLRYIADDYYQQGFAVVAPRLPGHGTVPSSLTSVSWEDWLAATRLAVREATRIAGADRPLHIVGFSNGGALAMKYTLDSLSDNTLRQPQQLILLSPMIGITRFARFAGLAGLPSVLPAFSKAAWLGIVPEFNPFKYNSFPVNAARQSWLLTQEIQKEMTLYAQENRLNRLPPILTFQSIMDSTVSTRAIVNSLYNNLQNNGSELVIFDINQAVNFRPLFRRSSYTAITNLLPPAPRRYSVSVVTNASLSSLNTVVKSVKAGEVDEHTTALNIAYPPDMFSLSHVALPFPVEDSLYGRTPKIINQYGISLGTISIRGESAVLIVGLDSIMRATSNPFYSWMEEHINRTIPCGSQRENVPCLNTP